MKPFGKWLTTKENTYTSAGHPILKVLAQWQIENPNSSFKKFWSQCGYNDPEAYQIAREEFYGMKNTRGQHVSARDLWR